ncbi:MAG: YkgJ family cysteine cluster protein [Planctomycetes bacterium]|nr:YkgJ family cysteine cluster protein [Planctomycetota bacterium]
MSADPHPCARCAQIQRTCCQRAEILLTGGDVARIRAHSGRADFDERRVPLDPAYLEHDPDDPEWLGLTVGRDGRRRMLVRRAEGDCTFLGAQGCVLPTEVRPLVCRLYPWSYTAGGLATESADYCPPVLLRFAGDSMLDVLDMQRADAERWRARLYDELRDDRGALEDAI